MLLLDNSNYWLKQASEIIPNSTALVFGETELSFNAFFERANSFSSFLRDKGIRENDHVGLLISHSKDFWICINAIWSLNAVPVLLNYKNTTEEICESAKQADVKFLVTEQFFIATNLLLSSQFNTITVDNIPIANQNYFNSKIFFSANKNAIILFTSGSSDKPKAVVHTFESIYSSVKAMDSEFHLSSTDKWITSLPFYHIGGFMILVRALLSGSTVFFTKSLAHQHIEDAIKNYQPTHVSFVSTTLKRMIDNKSYPNKNMKYLFLGGGYSSKKLCAQALKYGWPLVKVYGSTETCSMISAAKISEDKIESSGKVLKDNTIKIENGEILVSSKSLFREYYGNSKLTDEKLKNGFYHTNDVGWIDNDNFLYVESRRNDIIITGGENVSIREVELALLSLPQIKDAFVFAQEDDYWGQIICAVISAQINEETIKELLKEKIARYKIPKRIFFLNSLPRDEMGKIKRKEIFDFLKLSEL